MESFPGFSRLLNDRSQGAFPLMANFKFQLAAVLIATLIPTSAVADWWIVRSSDKKCLVVDIEPTPGRDATKIGKDRYSSVEEAEADVKQLCKGEGDGFER
jgi:hypothetical protein